MDEQEVRETMLNLVKTLEEKGFSVGEISISVAKRDSAVLQPAGVADLIDKISKSPCKPCMVNGAPGICCTWTF